MPLKVLNLQPTVYRIAEYYFLNKNFSGIEMDQILTVKLASNIRSLPGESQLKRHGRTALDKVDNRNSAQFHNLPKNKGVCVIRLTAL